jgi:hypothetical protein
MTTLLATDITCSCWFISEMHCIMSSALKDMLLAGTTNLRKHGLGWRRKKNGTGWGKFFEYGRLIRGLPFDHAHPAQKLLGVRPRVEI